MEPAQIEQSAGLLADSNFWVLMATVIFAIVAYKKGRVPVLAMLDARTAKIKADLEEAERLKNEAQALLTDIQKKHADAVRTSQKIIDNARQTATRLQEEAATKLTDSLKRREEQLLDRIARAETAAVQELRHQAADIAAKSAEILLQDAMSKRGAKLVDEAIAELPGKLN
jgi:F-type H+-transporting ATPase subunit b